MPLPVASCLASSTFFDVANRLRGFVRFFFAGARETECDKQGRFLVPANLRAYAKLEKEAVLIGVSNRVEIWSKTEWEQYSDAVTPSVTEIAETLTELGI